MRVFLSLPDVGELEESYIIRAIRSGWVAPVGPDVTAFELEVARRVGVQHAVALNSGTAALHLALTTWGIGDNHTVVVPTLTFAATANAVVYSGAAPYFVDCDAKTGNLDPRVLDTTLRELSHQGRPASAVIPVDLLGRCVDQQAIEGVAREHDVRILSDAAESVGSIGNVAHAGGWGDVAAFSFNGNKIMTTSGGGMLLTDNEEFADRARYLSTQARQPVAHYEHTEVGYNYRLSNLLAALGRAQLERLDSMMERRRWVRRQYREFFHDVKGLHFLGSKGTEDNCWLTGIVVDPGVTGWSRDDLALWLAEQEIESRHIWKPMHLQPVFAGFQSGANPVAEALFARTIVLPSGSHLTDEEMDTVLSAIATFLESRAPSS